MKEYDIICLTETWLHEDDCLSVNFANYRPFSAFRKETSFRGHGGVSLLVKDSIIGRFQQLPSKSNNIVWTLHKTNECIYLYCGVYFAPTNSPYASDNVLEVLQEELPLHIFNYRVNDVLIMGDFNARTGTLPDTDQNNRHDNDSSWSEDIPKRCNSDKYTNPRGEALLNFCKRSGLLIANGRAGLDGGIGKSTCFRPPKTNTMNSERVGSSLVDYLLVNNNAMNKLSSFDVLDRQESDHSPLVFNIGTETFVPPADTYPDACRSFDQIRWNEEQLPTIAQRFTDLDIIQLQNSVIEACQHDPSTAIQIVYDAVWNACAELKRTPKPNTTVHRSRPKPNRAWFDHECQDIKRRTGQLQRAFRHSRTEDNLLRFWESKNKYNIIIKEKRAKYEYTLRNKLLMAASENDRKFWSLLKQKDSYRQCPISPRDLHNYFEGLYSTTTSDTATTWNTGIEITDAELDAPFTSEEVMRAIRSCKPRKASGLDGIPGDVWKCATNLQNVLVTIFNAIFEGAAYPDTWREGLIVPLYKKGDPLDPNNYRGITLLSSLGKIFSSVFTKRLNNWIEKRDLLVSTQCGYRAGFSTMDNLFMISTIICKQFTSKQPRLYCCFVDFRKAYDFVDRKLLLLKLKKMGISDKMLKLIEDFYRKVFSCVRTGPQQVTDPFQCPNGLKQGENSSCILFSCYLNDLIEYMMSCEATSIQIGAFYMSVLLFADDLAIIDKTAKGLQRKLNILKDYCGLWNLQVNAEKTKVTVFTKNPRYVPERVWCFGSTQLEFVKTYLYVGITMNCNGSWTIAKVERARKGSRAMYAMLCNLRRFGHMPVRFMLSVFEKQIVPILLYGCEQWGLYGLEEVNAVADRFYRTLLGLRPNAPTTLARGELGRYSLAPSVNSRIAKYWVKLLNAKPNGALHQCYQAQRRMTDAGVSCWTTKLRDLLFQLGFRSAWENQCAGNVNSFVREIKQRTSNSEKSRWRQNVDSFGSLRYYKTLKTELVVEKFLDLDLRKNDMNLLVRFRGGLLRIGTNEGRWRGSARTCPICNSGLEETEEHVIFTCVAWNYHRTISGIRRMTFFTERNLKLAFLVPSKDCILTLIKFWTLVLEERQHILEIL